MSTCLVLSSWISWSLGFIFSGLVKQSTTKTFRTVDLSLPLTFTFCLPAFQMVDLTDFCFLFCFGVMHCQMRQAVNHCSSKATDNGKSDFNSGGRSIFDQLIFIVSCRMELSNMLVIHSIMTLKINKRDDLSTWMH